MCIRDRIQYGLVLFGVAVLGAAVALPSPTLSTPKGNSIRSWIESRIALLLPAACFLAGCAISYLVTLRYQRQEGGFGSAGYLSAYYYQGKFDARSLLEFSIDGTWSLLTYHLPEAVATAALAASALLLVAVLFRKIQGDWHGRAIAVLFSFCIAVSVCVDHVLFPRPFLQYGKNGFDVIIYPVRTVLPHVAHPGKRYYTGGRDDKPRSQPHPTRKR